MSNGRNLNIIMIRVGSTLFFNTGLRPVSTWRSSRPLIAHHEQVKQHLPHCTVIINHMDDRFCGVVRRPSVEAMSTTEQVAHSGTPWSTRPIRRGMRFEHLVLIAPPWCCRSFNNAEEIEKGFTHLYHRRQTRLARLRPFYPRRINPFNPTIRCGPTDTKGLGFTGICDRRTLSGQSNLNLRIGCLGPAFTIEKASRESADRLGRRQG